MAGHLLVLDIAVCIAEHLLQSGARNVSSSKISSMANFRIGWEMWKIVSQADAVVQLQDFKDTSTMSCFTLQRESHGTCEALQERLILLILL